VLYPDSIRNLFDTLIGVAGSIYLIMLRGQVAVDGSKNQYLA